MSQDTISSWRGKLKEIENISLAIIADDTFDTLPDKVKDAIYMLDMHEVESLTVDDISNITEVLGEYIEKNKKTL